MDSKPSHFVLEVIGAADHGARFELDHKIRTIGRAREVDFVLHDLSVSRQHLQVAVTPTGVQTPPVHRRHQEKSRWANEQ